MEVDMEEGLVTVEEAEMEDRIVTGVKVATIIDKLMEEDRGETLEGVEGVRVVLPLFLMLALVFAQTLVPGYLVLAWLAAPKGADKLQE